MLLYNLDYDTLYASSSIDASNAVEIELIHVDMI